MQASTTHLVVIPAYNPGPLLLHTVQQARAAWAPVWVVVDGSTDGSERALAPLTATDAALRVIRLRRNHGKGAAVRHALRRAHQAGFTHALVMDADAQHPADRIGDFMAASLAEPRAMVLGWPLFGPDAPLERVYWRRLSNLWANVETLWAGIGDSLFGFRVYPIAPLLEVMAGNRWMRRFDFEPEAAVRLCWRGVRPVILAAPVRYLARDAGGVSHFRYGRDNLLLALMHLRLLGGLVRRLPSLLRQRLGPRPATAYEPGAIRSFTLDRARRGAPAPPACAAGERMRRS
jgi:glycosyltransferase involved in cell wall biosynthesis